MKGDNLRTYYKLEDYHYKQIKEEGFEKGQKVWFFSKSDYKVKQGVIIGFGIHLLGDIEISVQTEEVCERTYPENVWGLPDKTETYIIEHTETAYLYHSIFHTEEETRKALKENIKNKIEHLEYEINYLEESLDRL